MRQLSSKELIPIRRGAVVGLLTRRSAANGIPHVTGVRTIDGEEVSADLIIDAMRRKKLRNPKHWAALVTACPRHAHWLDGEPITDVLPMAGTIDRYRRFVLDDAPVVTGIVSVGDSWACTNPSLGRGVAIGLMHALGTAEVVQQQLDKPFELALSHDCRRSWRGREWWTVSWKLPAPTSR